MNSPKLAPSSRRALLALYDLCDPDGCVLVAARAVLFETAGLPRGSWDRAVKALQAAEPKLVAIDPAEAREGRPSCYRLTAAGLAAAAALKEAVGGIEALAQRRVRLPASRPEPASESGGEPGRATLKTKSALRERPNSNNEPAEPGKTEPASLPPAPSGVVPVQVNLPWDPQEAIELLETLLAGYRSRVADGGATVVRVLSPVRLDRAAAPAASPPPADLDVPPPPACPIHGARVVAARKTDGALFWGCGPSWRGDHKCGTDTVGVEAHAAAHRAASVTASQTQARAERQETEREQRMRGRERPAELSTIGPEHLKEAAAARRSRDPRLDPQPGDELQSGTVGRIVRARSKGRVTWDVQGMEGETHSAALEQWVRWAEGGTVVRLGVTTMAQAVASVLESTTAQAVGAGPP